jgi:hypothetical protein
MISGQTRRLGGRRKNMEVGPMVADGWVLTQWVARRLRPQRAEESLNVVGVVDGLDLVVVLPGGIDRAG